MFYPQKASQTDQTRRKWPLHCRIITRVTLISRPIIAHKNKPIPRKNAEQRAPMPFSHVCLTIDSLSKNNCCNYKENGSLRKYIMWQNCFCPSMFFFRVIICWFISSFGRLRLPFIRHTIWVRTDRRSEEGEENRIQKFEMTKSARDTLQQAS